MSDQLSYEPPPQTLSAVPSRLDIAVIGLRLLGIYFLVHALSAGSHLLGYALPGAGAFSALDIVVSFLPVTLSAVGGVVLLVFSPSIGPRLLPRLDEATAYGVQQADFQALAFSVVGLYLVASAIPPLSVAVMHSIQNDVVDSYGIWTNSIQLVIGIAVFLQGRGVTAVWYKLRTTGSVPPEPEQKP